MTLAPPAGGEPSLRLRLDLRFTPEQSAQVCAANSHTVLELSADGQRISITPPGGDSRHRNTLLPGLRQELEEIWGE